MKNKTKAQRHRIYLGVDIGGTKVQASLVEETGVLLQRERCQTPRDGGSEAVLLALSESMNAVLEAEGIGRDELTAIGIGVPGVVDPDSGNVVGTPNMSLTGVAVGPLMEKEFKVPVAVGNDCNLGALGEQWLGSGRNTASMMGIFVGTGIGAGFVQNGLLWRGARESASEIGHIVMQVGGPKCGCGNLGCFEALASRSAVERDIREAVAAGRTTSLVDQLEGDLSMVRSGALRRALAAGDELVTEVMRRATETLGYACLTVRHLLDPEVIVLGGGVAEACGTFMLPIVRKILDADQLPGARPGGHVLLSALGDDAVALGAIALARIHAGRSPFKKQFAVAPDYPTITSATFGEITVDKEVLDYDIYIPVSGQVKRRKKKLAKKHHGSSHVIGPKEIDRICRGGPEVLFIGTGQTDQVHLTEEAQQFLDQRAIRCQTMPTAEVVEAYNDSKRRKAALVHVTC
ncbi:MAG: ROK family protein [Planctomycetes bacterium]|nr:ROK family protein [Planctomycetota bacterium]